MKMETLFLLFTGNILISLLAMAIIYSDSQPRDEKLAQRIVDCFSNLQTQTFFNGDVIVKDATGETKFYGKTEMDKNIDCLNKIIMGLRNSHTPASGGDV